MRPVVKDALLLELNQEKADILRAIDDMRAGGTPFARIQELVKGLIKGFATIRAKQLANNATILESERCVQIQMTSCKKTIDAAGQMSCKGVPAYVPNKCRSYMHIDRSRMRVTKEPSTEERYYHPVQFSDIGGIFKEGVLPSYTEKSGAFLGTRPIGMYDFEAVIIIKPDAVWNSREDWDIHCRMQPAPCCYFDAKEVNVTDIQAIAIKQKPGMNTSQAQIQVNQWIAANPKLKGIKIEVIDFDEEQARADKRAEVHGISVPADGSAVLRK